MRKFVYSYAQYTRFIPISRLGNPLEAPCFATIKTVRFNDLLENREVRQAQY